MARHNAMLRGVFHSKSEGFHRYSERLTSFGMLREMQEKKRSLDVDGPLESFGSFSVERGFTQP